MRKNRQSEANVEGIGRALTEAGCSIMRLSNNDFGSPDFIVGHEGATFLLTVMVGGRMSRRSKAQAKWHGRWKGSAVIVRSVTEALYAVGIAPVQCQEKRRKATLLENILAKWGKEPEI